jgi:hypothetical protein
MSMESFLRRSTSFRAGRFQTYRNRVNRRPGDLS